jgi:hypothetical protein
MVQQRCSGASRPALCIGTAPPCIAFPAALLTPAFNSPTPPPSLLPLPAPLLPQVIIPAPFWVSYPEMARLAGAVPVIVDSPAEEGFRLTPDRLRLALSPRSRLLILCTPSNPTGAVYSR